MADDFKEKQISPELVESTGNDSGSQPIAAFSNDETLIGQTVGSHYKILSKVGSGGMSTVFEARHLLLDRSVALKVILPQLVHNEHTAMRFQQEARAAAELDHPNICSVKEFGVDEPSGRAYLVMDLLDGITLQEVIETEGKLPTKRAIEIVSQICRALEFAHAKGVIHRDIKPSNIVLFKDESGKEKAKLVDFGIAKLTREDSSGPDLTKTGEVFGTPKYMSPEQCLGKKVDSRSDIYSVGCVLFAMLAGSPPYVGDSSLEVMMKHLNDPPRQLSSADVEPWLNNIVMKTLSKAPADRYETVSELLKDIANRNAPPLMPRSKKNTLTTIIATVITLAGCFILGNLLFAPIINQATEQRLQESYPKFQPAKALRVARECINGGSFKKALTYAEMAATSSKLASEYHLQKGRILAAKGELDSAIRELNKSIAINTQNADAFLCRGDVRRFVNDETDAKADYLTALKLYDRTLNAAPRDEYALANRGLTLTRLDRHKQALTDFNTAVSISPKELRNYYQRGWIKYKLEDFQGAIEDYTKAINLQPDDYRYSNLEIAMTYRRRALAFEKYGKRGWEKAKLDNEMAKTILSNSNIYSIDPDRTTGKAMWQMTVDESAQFIDTLQIPELRQDPNLPSH